MLDEKTNSSRMNNSILKIDELSHKYSVQWAVRDINLEIESNGVYGLLGSNGAGKSTIMNVVCGILKHSFGEVYINGINIKDNPAEAKRKIGFLPQQAPLHLNVTVEEYLRYAAHLREMDSKKIGSAIDRVLEQCSIKHMRNRVISNLSGGYKQRVGLAQAIIHSPSIAVLDEPTNALDPNQIVEVRHMIKAIAEECTVLLSTHVMSEVQAVCDQILMIEKGRQVFAGSVDEFTNYIQPSAVVVQLKAQPKIEEITALMPELLKVERLTTTKYRLISVDVQQTLSNVVEKAVTNNWMLTEVYAEKSSFDDIFAALSQNR